jgi:hypothetical protein
VEWGAVSAVSAEPAERCAAETLPELRVAVESVKEGRKVFFFEKKKQKTFDYLAPSSTEKSFLLLFFKKEVLSF